MLERRGFKVVKVLPLFALLGKNSGPKIENYGKISNLHVSTLRTPQDENRNALQLKYFTSHGPSLMIPFYDKCIGHIRLNKKWATIVPSSSSSSPPPLFGVGTITLETNKRYVKFNYSVNFYNVE